jgi:murein DD-endopeptidase MepM/ murein hydrolase activator NlpD
MGGFRTRRRRLRRRPRGLGGAALWGVGVMALAFLLGWGVAARIDHPWRPKPVAPAPPVQLAASRPPPPAPQTVPVEVRRGETFEAAVQRAGVAPAEARKVVLALAEAMDTVNIKAGLAFQAAVRRPASGEGHAELISLSLRDGPARQLTVSRTFDGAMTLKRMEEAIRDETVAADGRIEGSLYESALKFGATPAITSRVVKLFSHKLDFERDVQPGDRFRLVFDRKVSESGVTVEAGELEYAELHGVSFYRFERKGGEAEYFDPAGKNIKGFLLRTPVDGAHVTSRFGLRRHPILGYTRAHQGIDFGAGAGTPILAAGDGVVVEAGRKGGYGRWLRIRHTGAWDTGYAHVSRFARGVRPGARVRQGQVVAYVGSTGLATGPHLHYEVWKSGRRVNPLSAKVPQGTVLAGRELTRFKAEKARIDRLLAQQAQGPALAIAETGKTQLR